MSIFEKESTLTISFLKNKGANWQHVRLSYFKPRLGDFTDCVIRSASVHQSEVLKQYFSVWMSQWVCWQCWSILLIQGSCVQLLWHYMLVHSLFLCTDSYTYQSKCESEKACCSVPLHFEWVKAVVLRDEQHGWSICTFSRSDFPACFKQVLMNDCGSLCKKKI